METKTKNGQGSKMDATQQKDTQKGATVLKSVTDNKPTAVIPINPIQDRLKKLNEAQKLIEKRKRLIDGQDKVNKFEEGLNGEDDSIILNNEKGRRDELEITKPDAVRKVLDLLKKDMQEALALTDSELLTIAL
jgi:hypothetical protein